MSEKISSYCIASCFVFIFFCLASQVQLGKGTKLIKKGLCCPPFVWKLQLCQLLMSFQLYFYLQLKIQLSWKNHINIHVCSLFPSLGIFPVSFRWYSLFCSCLHCFVIVYFVMKLFNRISKNFEKKNCLSFSHLLRFWLKASSPEKRAHSNKSENLFTKTCSSPKFSDIQIKWNSKFISSRTWVKSYPGWFETQ